MKLTFRQEEIFKDIPDDPENVIMKIPEEIMDVQGWKQGDTIKVEWGDQGTIKISKVEPKEE